MLDVTLQAFLVTLIVQGLKQLGFIVGGDAAKVVTLAVAALFLFANGLIDAFVPAEYRPVVQSIVDFLKLLLGIAAPAGVYGYAKLVAAK